MDDYDYECPEYIDAGLAYLATEIETIERNKNPNYESPIYNNGATYETPIFKMRAYYWGDDEETANLPNFEYEDLKIQWYKYMGRSMTMNKPIDANEFSKIIQKCLDNIRADTITN